MTLPVLHLNELLCVGGASKVMENLARLADRSRFTPVLAGVSVDDAYVSHLRASGITAGAIGQDLSGLSALIEPGQPFAVIVHRSGNQQPVWDRVLPALKQSGAATILERSIFGYPDSGPANNAIDIHVCNSLNTLRRDWMRRGRPKLGQFLRHHRAIYNPVVVQQRDNIEHAGLELRRNLGIAEDSFVISTMTRPDPDKLDYLLAVVFPRLLREVPNAHLIARRLPDEIAVPLERRCAGRFHNLPVAEAPDEALATLAAGDVMVHMSTIGESFGMAIAEAMRLGKPVITNETRQDSKSNAQGELIRCGIDGLLINDSWTVLQQLIRLAKQPDLRNEIGHNAMRRFEQGPLNPLHVIGQWQHAIAEGMGKASGLTKVDEPSSHVTEQAFRRYLAECDGPSQASRAHRPLTALPWSLQADARRLCYRGWRKMAA